MAKMVFIYGKDGLPDRGLEPLAGESSTALAHRAEREKKEGETVSAVYSRFSTIPASLMSKAWQGAFNRKESALAACERLKIDPAYIPAWRSLCLAVKPDAKILPESAAAKTDDASKGLSF